MALTEIIRGLTKDLPWLKTCTLGDCRRAEVIATALALGNYDKILWLFRRDKPEMFAGPEIIIAKAGVFSSGEQVLIRFACDVWFGTSHCPLSDLLRLDSDNFLAVERAILKWRSI